MKGNVMLQNPDNKPYYDQLANEILELKNKKFKISLYHLFGVLFIIGLQILEIIFIALSDVYVFLWPLILIAYNLFCIAWQKSVSNIILEKRLHKIDVEYARNLVRPVKS